MAIAATGADKLGSPTLAWDAGLPCSSPQHPDPAIPQESGIPELT
jgi:hypothetical protein